MLAQNHTEQAINIFLELDINPAKVVALYPVEVAGRLAQPREKWIELFGEKSPQGSASATLLKDVEVTAESSEVAAVVDAEQPAPQAAPASHEPDTKPKVDTSSSRFLTRRFSLSDSHSKRSFVNLSTICCHISQTRGGRSMAR